MPRENGLHGVSDMRRSGLQGSDAFLKSFLSAACLPILDHWMALPCVLLTSASSLVFSGQESEEEAATD